MVENAFIAITPYQIFNILNFVYNDVNGVRGKSDLFVYDHFRNSDEIIKRIREEGIFENVYKYTTVKDIGIRLFSKMRTLIFFVNPKLYFHKVLNLTDYVEVLSKHYINIYQCSDGLFMNTFHRIFQNTNNYLVEDGLYSYYGNMKADRTGGDYKFVNKYLLCDSLNLHAKKVYVNSPELCESTSAKEICGLPSLRQQENLFEVLNKIFSYKSSDWYQKKKFIYLTTPYENLRNVTWKNGISNNDKEIADILIGTGDDFAIRLHPRQKNLEDYDNMSQSIDVLNNMWELECRNYINDDKVLVSFFSTAVFTPKILYDREPYIIFTYKMLTKEIFGDSVVERLKGMYRDKSKIFVPENVVEFCKVIHKLSRGMSEP